MPIQLGTNLTAHIKVREWHVMACHAAWNWVQACSIRFKLKNTIYTMEVVVKGQVQNKQGSPRLPESVPDLAPADRVPKIQNGRHNTGRLLSMKVSSSIIHFLNRCDDFLRTGFNGECVSQSSLIWNPEKSYQSLDAVLILRANTISEIPMVRFEVFVSLCLILFWNDIVSRFGGCGWTLQAFL